MNTQAILYCILYNTCHFHKRLIVFAVCRRLYVQYFDINSISTRQLLEMGTCWPLFWSHGLINSWLCVSVSPHSLYMAQYLLFFPIWSSLHLGGIVSSVRLSLILFFFCLFFPCTSLSWLFQPARSPTRHTDTEKPAVTERGRGCWDCLIGEGQVFHSKSCPGCLATNGVTGYPSYRGIIVYQPKV